LGISAFVIDAVETSREFCICDGHHVCTALFGLCWILQH